jgi:hypothetical protein
MSCLDYDCFFSLNGHCEYKEMYSKDPINQCPNYTRADKDDLENSEARRQRSGPPLPNRPS